MVKKISVSVSEYVWEMYVSQMTGNRSKEIERLIIIGSESEVDNFGKLRKRLVNANNRIQELEQELHNFKLQNGSLKQKLEDKKWEKQARIVYK